MCCAPGVLPGPDNRISFNDMIVDVPKLLDEICVKLGMCLDPADRSRLCITPYRDIDSFELAVLKAERMDPLKTDRRVREALRDYIARHFQSE